MAQNEILITKKQAIYATIFLMALVYVMPIVLMNEYYKDDLEVAIHGMAHGLEHGRPVQDLLLALLNLNYHIIDVRPLPVILAAILGACSALLLGRRYACNSLFYGGLCGLLLLFNPFFIEVLFFGFTAFTITFSVLCAVFPFSEKVHTLNFKKQFSIAFICYLLILMNYQPAICLSLVLICADYIFNIRDKIPLRNIFRRIGLNVVSVLSAQLVYMFIIAPLIVSGVYASQRSSLGEDIVRNITYNISQFSELFSDLLQSSFFIPTLPILVIAYIVFIKWTNDYLKAYQTQFHLLLRFFSIISPIILLFASLAPLLMLENTVIRIRVVIGFGGVLFICFLIFINTFQNKKIINALIFLPVFYLFVCVYNATSHQKETMKQEYTVTSFIYHDIIKQVDLANVDAVFTFGRLNNVSLIVLNGKRANPFMINAISTGMYGSWEPSGLYQNLLRLGLRKLYIAKDHKVLEKINDRQFCKAEKPVIKTTEYNLYVIDRILFVDLGLCVTKPVYGTTTPQGIYW